MEFFSADPRSAVVPVHVPLPQQIFVAASGEGVTNCAVVKVASAGAQQPAQRASLSLSRVFRESGLLENLHRKDAPLEQVLGRSICFQFCLYIYSNRQKRSTAIDARFCCSCRKREKSRDSAQHHSHHERRAAKRPLVVKSPRWHLS
ncbi:hypothetical protein LZ32DRAFT_28079 [Colletotrichum eremochloae]|nr:hypothetical protein LZ32DRAFT_28079 [Colletotrichum eremochloae]